MPQLKYAFAGTPDFAAAHLQFLLQNKFIPSAVFTQPDRRSGRGKKLLPSPVKSLALEADIRVYQPISLKTDESENLLKELDIDLLIVVAYGLILPKAILDIPKFGCINVHASLLPRWRGAAPIERAILAGDEESGVTIMQMDEGLDTGDMLHRVSVTISSTDTREDLERKLIDAGSTGLLYTLDNFHHLQENATKQSEEGVTYANKLEKTESLLNFENHAENLSRTIRAVSGRQPAYSFFNGERIRILAVRPSTQAYNSLPGTIEETNKEAITVNCLDSSLEVTQVQLPGKNPVSVRDFRNSKPDYFSLGKVFSNEENAE